MTYKEVEALYLSKKDQETLEALITFFEYHHNNQKVLYYIADCFCELKRYFEGLNFVLPKIDNKTFFHNRYSGIIRKLIKGILDSFYNKEKSEIIDIEKYGEYVNLLKELWMEYGEKIYLSTYGFECRKMNWQNEFLLLLHSIKDESIINDQYVNNAKIWCLYDLNIKNFNITRNTNESEIEYFFIEAEKIISNCSQEDINNYYNNPYGLTIVKAVKILNQRSHCNHKEIIKWLERLDVNKLPADDEKQYINSFGRECENASTREFYYYQLARAYEKAEEYEKCINICKKALLEDLNFHYKNKLWLKSRMLYCECQIANDKQIAINNYKKIVDKNDFWFMRHKLACVYFNNNMLQEALKYNCLAFDIEQEDKKLINIIYDLAYILETLKYDNEAKIFFLEYIKIRNKYSWDIPYDIEIKARLYNLDLKTSKKVNLHVLKNMCYDLLVSVNHFFEGRVKYFTKNNMSGFIKLKKGCEIFFNKHQVKFCNDIKIGDIVLFEIVENKKGNKAINIIKKEKNNGKHTY